jgi:hypothetical protein
MPASWPLRYCLNVYRLIHIQCQIRELARRVFHVRVGKKAVDGMFSAIENTPMPTNLGEIGPLATAVAPTLPTKYDSPPTKYEALLWLRW